MSTKVVALLACWMPVAANAIPITFTGTTVAADGSLGIAIGDAFEATVDFDLSSPTASSGVNFTDYEIGGAALVSAGGYSSAGSITYINVANDYAFQRYDAWAAIGTVGAGLPLLLVLKDPDGTAFDGTPLNPYFGRCRCRSRRRYCFSLARCSASESCGARGYRAAKCFCMPSMSEA